MVTDTGTIRRMGDKAIYGVVVSTAPLEIRAQRQTYVAEQGVVGLARGAVVKFAPTGATATRVKVAAPIKSRFVPGRHHGIISCERERDGRGEHLVWVSLHSLASFYRELGDEIRGEPLQLGDYVAFDAHDGLAWDPEFRGRAPRRPR